MLAAASAAAEALSPRRDLMYYFEVLNKERAGWFDSDPNLATPYHVVRVVEGEVTYDGVRDMEVTIREFSFFVA